MSTISKSDLYRRLPSLDELLRSEEFLALIAAQGRVSVVEASRAVLEQLRDEISAGRMEIAALDAAVSGMTALVKRELESIAAYSLRRVINATGVVLHTNLGRAPLSPSALAHVAEVAGGYSNLEFDLARGERGRRDEHAQRLFSQLFAREGVANSATLVVNNNAAAVLLALNTLADGGEVIVSRGELVEIGGSFRIPDVMSRSGAVLREVGTTNRTRVADYAEAINERTRLLLRVHRSNFEIVGFTEQPSLAELVELGRRHNIPVMEDLGSGALVALEQFGISDEPNVFASLRAGVALVTYSGDKLLGGPQAGMVSGEPALVARLRANPLFRALRVDKMCYAALEATLAAYLRQDYDAIPLVQMLAKPEQGIRLSCEALAAQLKNQPSLSVEVVPTRSVVGGGAAPGKTLPSFALAVLCAGLGAHELARRLRESSVPVIARVENDRVLFDLRTVQTADESSIYDALVTIAANGASASE